MVVCNMIVPVLEVKLVSTSFHPWCYVFFNDAFMLVLEGSFPSQSNVVFGNDLVLLI